MIQFIQHLKYSCYNQFLFCFSQLMSQKQERQCAGYHKQSEREQMSQKETIYLSRFLIFDQSLIQIITNYKCFLQNSIVQLGQDWRIESNLLTQDLFNHDETSQPTQYSIFNQFLSVFIRNRIGREKQSACDNRAQEQFIRQISDNLSSFNPKTKDSLTFKTLSLGFWITCSNVWSSVFQNQSKQKQCHKQQPCLKAFAIKHQFIKDNSSPKAKDIIKQQALFKQKKQDNHSDLMQNQQFHDIKWIPFSNLTDIFSEKQIKKLQSAPIKNNKTTQKSKIVSGFVVQIKQIHLKSTGKPNKNVRIVSLSSMFYLQAFIVWLLFNIKAFFSMGFDQYLLYVKYQLGVMWTQKFKQPLKKFHELVERQWNKLLKDYSVALNDDTKVLRIFIARLNQQVSSLWNSKISSVHSFLNN